MDELKNFLLGDYRETMDYVKKVERYGLTKFPPLIISCAITGGMHGKESNPNLPEEPEEQAQQSYDAYNAGASPCPRPDQCVGHQLHAGGVQKGKCAGQSKMPGCNHQQHLCGRSAV